MLGAFSVVWRECLEAILVVAIVLSWIVRQPNPAPLRAGVLAGVAAGVLLAMAMGAAVFGAAAQLEGQPLEVLQAAMAIAAALMIVHMVAWMQRHGAGLRHEIELHARRAANPWGIGALVALAVAREGAETVVYLYGMSAVEGAEGHGAPHLWLGGAAGLAAALACAWALTRGARWLRPSSLLRVSTLLLLSAAVAMLGNGIERLISLEWLPLLADPLWDSSALLADGEGLGRVLADFAGYRARPTGTLVLAYAVFGLLVLWLFAWPRRGARRG